MKNINKTQLKSLVANFFKNEYPELKLTCVYIIKNGININSGAIMYKDLNGEEKKMRLFAFDIANEKLTVSNEIHKDKETDKIVMNGKIIKVCK